MDMIKLLSIEGFVDYYLHFCARTDELRKAARKLKRAGKTDEARAKDDESFNLIPEMQAVVKKYALMCTQNELKEALGAYPEESKEYAAVRIVWERKQALLKPLNDYLGL